MGTILINSMGEFLENGGEPLNYLGRAYYSWHVLGPGGKPMLCRCADHPIVRRKKFESLEFKDRLAALQREIRVMDLSIAQFEKGTEV